MERMDFRKISLSPARCGADLSNGSERASYVPMKHIFKVLKRPHRAVNLMFTYYPFDKGWPKRASELVKWKAGMGQWDLPYDDYEVFLGGEGGSQGAEVFRQFRDVRRYGQDINFTLTIDLKVPVKGLRAIARDLRPYGRVFFRINHECNGNWFQHNKRYSFKQVSDFFCKFHNIIKEEAPLVQTVLCVNGWDSVEMMHLGIRELGGAVRTADILALDKYISLHFGWPNKFRDDPGVYNRLSVKDWWENVKFNYREICKSRGSDSFPFTLPEINADSDVDGYYGQARKITEVYDLIKTERPDWLHAMTLYQFRDRGGLGLELEDRKTHQFIRRLPSCAAYRKAVSDPYYNPGIIEKGVLKQNGSRLKLRWYNSEKADGIRITGRRPLKSLRAKLELEKGNYIIQANGRWLHTAGGEVDLKSYLEPGSKYSINVFAPPAEGVNSIGPDGGYLPYYQTELSKTPQIVF
ncbi:MAG TPA: hypothetical protein PLE24_07115 [Chitinispirillaceae bacterium]|nr:hypothetical protein [Chitinispirillaceae bacterium]